MVEHHRDPALPLTDFPAWKPLPIATALAATLILTAVTGWMLSRKELK